MTKPSSGGVQMGSSHPLVFGAAKTMTTPHGGPAFPAGARVVSRKLSHWGSLRVSSSDCSSKPGVRIHSSFELQPGLDHSHTVEVLSIGVPREPDDFVAAAVKASHPRMLPYMKNEPVDDLLRLNLAGSRYELHKSRNDWLKRWLQRSRELQPDEDKLRDSMPEHVRIVLRGKRLLLMDEMLRSIDHPDVHLVKDICNGFTLSGWMVDSGCFLRFPRPPQMTLDSLLRSSAGLSRATVSRIEAGASDEVARKAWAETEQEVNKGWLWEDLSGDLRGKVVANRFGLAQKSKTRVIDDFKLCGLNSTVGLPEKHVLHGVDYIAATLMRGMSKFGLKRGALVGKTFDLTAAYKQFAICEKDRRFSPGGHQESRGRTCACLWHERHAVWRYRKCGWFLACLGRYLLLALHGAAYLD